MIATASPVPPVRHPGTNVPAAPDAERRLRDALRAHGAAGPVLDELLVYARNEFAAAPAAAEDALPLPDEPFVAAWERYVAEAETCGVWSCLRDKLVQLRFPVAAGTSQRPDYQAATRRGILPAAETALTLVAPDSLRLWLHSTPAGRIPVLLISERADFVTLVQALTHRNEPVVIPDAMGACIVAGYNNWDRVHELRRTWQREHPAAPESQWQEEFRALVPQKERYQDRFILLSSGAYSATPAEVLGLDPREWSRLSILVRLEHECAHYFTRRVFGSMRNSLHDEVIADYAGITAAVGEFRKDWFLRFLGLEDFPRYRAGGRFENYRGKPPLSEEGLGLLHRIVVRAAEQLERLDRSAVGRSADPRLRSRMLAALTRLSLPELAASESVGRLHYELVSRTFR